MKTLKRLAVGQLNDLERLSMRELCNFVGGSSDYGCLWDALGYALTFCDGLKGNEGDDFKGAYANQFKNRWQEKYGGKVNSKGDPSPSQKDMLFDLINEAFVTTGSSWGSSNWQGMINGSTSRMALVMIGDDTNQHAYIISGERQEESDPYNPGGKRYYYLDKNDNRVYENDIKYGTGLSSKSSRPY